MELFHALMTEGGTPQIRIVVMVYSLGNTPANEF